MQDNNYIFHQNCKLYKKKIFYIFKTHKILDILKDLLKIFLIE